MASFYEILYLLYFGSHIVLRNTLFWNYLSKCILIWTIHGRPKRCYTVRCKNRNWQFGTSNQSGKACDPKTEEFLDTFRSRGGCQVISNIKNLCCKFSLIYAMFYQKWCQNVQMPMWTQKSPQKGGGSTGSRVVWAQASLGLSVCLFLLLSGYFVQCSAFLRTLLWNCGESRRGCAITIQSWRFNWDFRSGSVQQWQLLVHKTHLQIWYVSTVNVEIVQNWTKHFHILKREFRQKQVGLFDPDGSEYFFSLIN